MPQDNVLVPDQLLQSWDPESRDFLQRMYSGDQGRYDERIKAIGFQNMNRVLDAGCGFGQWTLRLSKHNAHVDGIDINPGRILAAQQIAKSHKISNVTFKYGTHTATGFPDSHFDAIFCYGSIFLTHEGRAISELCRVLKPGGKIYFNYNGLGTYLYFLIQKGIKESNRSYVDDALDSMTNTLLFRRHRSHIITKRGIQTLLKNNNFEILAEGPDGHISVRPDSPKSQPLFLSRYFGLTTLTEILAQKRP